MRMHSTNIRKPALSSSLLMRGGLSVHREGGNAPKKIVYNNNIIFGSRYYLRSTAFKLLVRRKYTCTHTHSNVCKSGGESFLLRGGGW